MKKDIVYNGFERGQTEELMFQNGLYRMQNADIFDNAGLVTGQLKLTEVTPEIVTEPCYPAVMPNGDVYFLSATSGKRWRKAYNGPWSTFPVNPNGKHLGGEYYNGYLYYATDDKLGRFDLASNWNDNFKNLIAGKPHPFTRLDLMLYIGNDNDVASVDDTGVFTSSAFDTPQNMRITDMLAFEENLAVIDNSDKANDSRIFLWNTVGKSWSTSDPIKESLFALMDADNYVFALTPSGNIYQYNGRALAKAFKTRPFTSTNNSQTRWWSARTMFANGNQIFSLDRKTIHHAFTMVGEFSTIEDIFSIISTGDQLYVSTAGGMFELSTDRADAILTTPVATASIRQVTVGIYSLPEGTDIKIEIKEDNGEWIEQEVMLDLEDSRTASTDVSSINRRHLQARVTLVANGDKSPIIDSIILER